MQSHGSKPEVLLLLAVCSRYSQALKWARDAAERNWGPAVLASSEFAFTETDYYRPTMGPDLLKQFLVFQELVDPATLPDRKLITGRWETDYAIVGGHPEPRPLNLDPGYLTLGKLVLASTKDHSHRLYLGQGIYGEVTLYYRHGAWQPREWTYPDYRRGDYQQFFSQARDYYFERIRRGTHP